MKKRSLFSTLAVVATLASSVALGIQDAKAEGSVNVYSFRQKNLIQPLFDQFTKDTGIEVRLLSGSAETLFERLKNEGMNSPADVLMTSDAGRLIRAKNAGLFQTIDSATLNSLVPENYRDTEGTWFGLSVRARVIVISKDRVKDDEINTYEDLTNDKWKNRICIRSSGNIYNQSLLASLIAHLGAEQAEAWAQGVTDNMARKPQGGDRDQVKAVASGECDVAVVNSYYLAQMMSGKDDEKDAMSKVRIIWPNQDGRGAHVNISGAGVTKSAKNRDNAIKLLEFLASDEAQKIYAETNKEFPIRDSIAMSDELKGWGPFKADDINLTVFGEHQEQALRIFDRVGWR